MNNQSVVSLLLALLAASPTLLRANGMRLVSQDGFASARGEAFAATADNPSAIYYNPAGITQLEGNNLRSGIYALSYDATYRPPDTAPNSGITYHSEADFAAATSLFYTHTFKDSRLSAGFGIYAPYGAGLTWPDDTGFRTVGTKSELIYVRFNPVLAVKLLPGLSIAGGVMLDYGRINLEQGLRPVYQPPNVNFFYFAGDGLALGYNLGLLWQPHETISLGATFRSTTKVTMDGHSQFQQTPGPIAYTRLPAEADFEFPLTAVIGLSYRPTPKWNLEVNADYTDWNSFGTITIYQHGTVPLGVKQNPSFILDWEPSWMYEFGITRYFENGWHVSGGYLFNQNSVPDANYSPLTADLDRHFVTVGTGLKGKRFDFDITYQFGFGIAETVAGSVPSTAGQFAGQTADGTYDFVSHGVLLTVGLRF